MNGSRIRLAGLVSGMAVLIVSLCFAGAAGADMETFGSTLSATPTLDTANGNYLNTSMQTGTESAISPSPHYGEDTSIWNVAQASGPFSAPATGQVLSIKVKGCTIKDGTAPTDANGNQFSVQPGGPGPVPVNFVEFQALQPQGGGAYMEYNTAQGPAGSPFEVPFCSNAGDGTNRHPNVTVGAVNTSTVTTYQPLHMCVNHVGDVIAFHDVGGFIEPLSEEPQPGLTTTGGNSWYSQGAPFDVIAAVPGSTMNSYVGLTSTFSPSDTPTEAGFGVENDEELMMQITLGTGNDAYALCPGGHAIESGSSNTVICVNTSTDPGSTVGTCGTNNTPVFAPVNQTAPTISGTPEVGQRLNETHGTWTNSPYGYPLQWERCDTSGSNCQAISGATKGYYYPTTADVGSTIVVQESATNDANTEGPVSSAPTAVIAAKGTKGVPTTGPTGGGGSAKFSAGKLKLAKYTFTARKGTTLSYNDTKAGTTVISVTRRGSHKVLVKATHTDTPGTNTSVFKPKLGKGFYIVTIKTTFSGQVKTSSHGFRIVT